MANYALGSGDPKITPDAGAGVWNSKSKTLDMRTREAMIYQILPSANLVIGDDAVRHMYHYLGNTGNDLTIDLQGMLNDVEDERRNFEAEMLLARRFVQGLRPGCYMIHSQKATVGYAKKSESKNWFFATGGYSYWGKGVATVDTNDKGERTYNLAFEYKFYDRYNWDGGKSVTIGPVTITDAFMGEFHRQGLAKEFDMFGSVRRNIKWTGMTFSNPAVTDPGGRS